MLILTVRLGERLFIGGHYITVKVVAVQGTQVKLGVDAPREVPVHREAIQRRIDERGRE